MDKYLGRIAYDNPNVMELAIIIHPKYRGKGFAKAGVFEYMKHIIDTRNDITRFRMEIEDENYASLGVAKRLEFDLAKYQGDKIQYWEKDAR